jgi:small nuclear ribonucleoprotein (snRNP)-like protein
MGDEVVDHQRSVVRLNDGRLLKGYLKDFSPNMETVVLREAETGEVHTLKTGEMKAVFFVKSFEGDYDYKEKKSYGIRKPTGNRVFVKFKDGERLVGFVDGKVPWQKGFFLSNRENEGKGFFLLPVDEDTNNIRVFVVSSAVDDVTVVP